VVGLKVDDLQRREEHWAIVDMVGKAGHIRTVPIPDWVIEELQNWLTAAGIDRGKIFRRVSKMGKPMADPLTAKAVWHIVKDSAHRIGVAKLAPHDLRRSCARLCQEAGGELQQIQMLLGHVSIQTTERYLGSKQRIRYAVNDRIGIEPPGPSPEPEPVHGRKCTGGDKVEGSQAEVRFPEVARRGSSSGSTMARRGGETDGLRPG
jgi:integrase